MLSDFLMWILMASLKFSIFFLTSPSCFKLWTAASWTLSSFLVSLALCIPDFLWFLWGFVVLLPTSVHPQMWLLPQALLVLLSLCKALPKWAHVNCQPRRPTPISVDTVLSFLLDWWTPPLGESFESARQVPPIRMISGLLNHRSSWFLMDSLVLFL